MKRSVHFGLNQVNPDQFSGWNGALWGCWKDCCRTAEVMATANFESRAFYDEECTVEKARLELTEAAESLSAGDTLLFSDSGHGSRSPGGLYGSEEGLVLYDGILVDSEFRSLLSRFRAGVNVISILDVCHAAGLSRAMPAVRARVAPLFVTRGIPGNPKPRSDVNSNCIIMAACTADELSGDTDEGGAFTMSMLSVLTEDMTWGTLMAATRRLMSNKHPSQHPELVHIGGSGLEDQPIASL